MTKERNGGTGISESWKKVLDQKATPEQLEEIRNNIALENKKDTIKNIIVFVLIFIFLGLFILRIYYYLKEIITRPNI